MSHSSVQSFLNRLVNFEKIASPRTEFKLHRVKLLLKNIGNPQQQLKCLHIAGTKGKGSTAMFAASILASSGYRVGLYTSPHISDYKERIRILTPDFFKKNMMQSFAGVVSERELKNALAHIRPAIEEIHRQKWLGRLTYFEVLTVLAFYYFFKAKTDVVVLETGLGGRLDATNVIDSLVAAIAPISIDHTFYLGNSLKKIAAEKAGIIKDPKQDVVLAPQPPSALAVIRRHCQALGISPKIVGKDLLVSLERQDLEGIEFTVEEREGSYHRLRSSLLGSYQAVNAAVAIGMMGCLRKKGFKIQRDAIRKGIALTRWPARFEVICRRPLVVLDGAHNPASCQVLVETFKAIFPGKRAVLVLGCSKDKDRPGMAGHLRKIIRTVIATRADHERAYRFSLKELKKLFLQNQATVTASVRQAIRAAGELAGRQDVILVTGSLFVVGEARTQWIPSNISKTPSSPYRRRREKAESVLSA